MQNRFCLIKIIIENQVLHFLNIWQIQIGVWIQKLWNKIFRLKYVVPTEIQVSKSAKNISLKKKSEPHSTLQPMQKLRAFLSTLACLS